jgi:hypothetical protein
MVRKIEMETKILEKCLALTKLINAIPAASIFKKSEIDGTVYRLIPARTRTAI